MLNAARQHLLRLAALAALAFAAPAMAEDCFEQEGKCFGVWWMTATPAKVANVNVQARDDKGNTPLHIAAYSNTNPEVVNALIKNGAEVNAKNKEGNTPLHSAAAVWWGLNPEVINALIKSGADSSIKNNNGHTALELGKKGPILYGFYRSEIHQLLKEAAEKQKKKYPATSAAAEDCREQEGKCFGVDWNTATPAEVANVDVKAKDDNGRTPLHWAIYNGASPKIINALIKNGADVNAKDEHDFTPLHLVIGISEIEIQQNPEIVNALIKGSADVNAKDKYGNTPLHLAARDNTNPEIVNTLIQSGADVNAKDEYGWTPLHLAEGLMEGHYRTTPEAINALIKGGAEVNAKGKDGNTPLHLAVYGNPEVVNALIKNGADISIKNNAGITALEQGKQHDIFYGKVVFYGSEAHQLLLKEAAKKQKGKYPSATAMAEDCWEQEGKCFGVDWNTATPAEVANVNVKAKDDRGRTPFYAAAWWNKNPDVLKALLHKGADVNAKNQNGVTPLHAAALHNGKPEIINAIIEGGADVNAKDTNGDTPLHSATRFDTNPKIVEVVNSLVTSGADVNAKSNNGNTPLILAAEMYADPEVVNALIQNGADVNAKNNNGNTPLHWAAFPNALIKNGADVNAKNRDGETPLHWAAEAKHVGNHVLRNHAVNALIQNGADISIKNNDGKTALELGEGNENFYKTEAYQALKAAADKQKG